MERLIFILGVSFGSLALGYAMQRLVVGASAGSFDRLKRISGVMKLVALVGLQPIPIINSFWRLTLGDARLLALPLLGALSLVVGGTAAILYIRAFRVPPYQAGSLFTSGMFTNIGIFGALIGYVLYGPVGFTVVQLFRVFEEVIYYAVGFPLSQQIGKGALQKFRFNWRLLTDRPLIAVPIGAILLGSALKWIGFAPPQVLAAASGIIVPVMTGGLGFAIGVTLRIARISAYRRQVLMVLSIKYLLIPAIIIPLALAFGLRGLMDGVAFKMVAIISFMPTAFIALVPPALYDFDLDLANSCWLVTTLALLLVFPLLYFLLA